MCLDQTKTIDMYSTEVNVPRIVKIKAKFEINIGPVPNIYLLEELPIGIYK